MRIPLSLFAMTILSILGGCTVEPPTSNLSEQTGRGPVAETPISAVAAPVRDLERGAQPELIQVDLEEPSQHQTVTVGMALGRTTVAANEQVMLVVKAKMAAGWHIYAAEGPTGVGRPTKLRLTLPDGVSMTEGWTLPAAETKSTALGTVGMYHGDVLFSVPLSIAPNREMGTEEIICDFHYQSCTDSSCLPPTSMRLVANVSIR